MSGAHSEQLSIFNLYCWECPLVKKAKRWTAVDTHINKFPNTEVVRVLRRATIDCIFLSSPKSYVQTLIPNVIVSGDRIFGR